MKNCSNCGASFEDDAAFCPNCGKETEAEKTETAAENSNENAAETTASNKNPADKIKKNLPIIIGAAAVIVLLIIIISAFSCGGGYKSVVSNYNKFMNGKTDEKFIEKLAPEEYWDSVEDNYDADAGDVADALEKFFRKNEIFGVNREDVKYSVSIEKTYKLSDKLLDTARKALKDNYSISKKDVTEVRGIVNDLTFKLDLEEVDNDYLLEATAYANSGRRNVMYAAKINGKWYLFDQNFESFLYDFMYSPFLD